MFTPRRFVSKKTEFLPIHDRISKISFSVFTSEELIKLAVKKITTPLTFDPLGHPIPGGLYDKALGPINDKSDPCGTCLKYVSECPGHMGYIELPLPVVNPMFHSLIGNVLKNSCLQCFTVQLPALVKHSLSIQMRLLDNGMVAEATELEKLIFVIAQKSESQESISDEATESIDHFDKLSKTVKDEQDKSSCNITKNTEQLRQQFFNNLTKFFKTRKTCISCSQPRERIKYQKNRVILSSKSNKTHDGDIVKEFVTKYVNPDESRNFMREIWKQESEFLLILAPVLDNVKDKENPTDIFYFEVLPVPPPQTRPANFVKGKVTEHSKTNAYRAVLHNNIILSTIIHVMKHEGENDDGLSVEAKAVYKSTKGESSVEKLSIVWEDLQVNVDDILNKNTSKQNEFLGLKQILEKKQGLLRMHMMGKRVNFSARSVITPDPNLRIDEVGIPDTFAMQLSYPTYVNSHNIDSLRKMVMNGPNVHPGALYVQFQSGKMVRLDPNNATQREAIAKKLLTPEEAKTHDYSCHKVVHRHLCNGDILLLNRQPSLHKPSVMAHKARILKNEKTFRLHYANCKAYNADFDGDEMNVHFPQTEVARSEAYSLLNVSNQYLVPKDGTPLSGLIQDHVIAGVKLSMRGKFFCKMDYHQLVFQGLYHRTREIKTLPPAIMKPQILWSGKQVLSTIIINLIPEGRALISLKSKSKIKPKDWQNAPSHVWRVGGRMKDEYDMSESEVILKSGELLTGVLDKAHYGATPFGLIHCMYELYGGACATEMLSSLTRVFTAFLQMQGFTLGIRDILTDKKANKKRKKIINKLRKEGPEVMKKALDLPNDTHNDDIVDIYNVILSRTPNTTALIDRSYKSCLDAFTNEINTSCLSEGLVSKFPENNLQLMVISGAKGSTVNTMQMSCCLGQIELEGKRPPVMISGKTLPSFPDFDFSPRAGGFIEGRFLTGIQPQEFFFHCMAGREGLIDTAVKTSRSGYLQRCLVKSLEGVQVKPDLTVRDSDNSVIQFLYGGDGMDVGKAQFLSEKHLSFLHENMDAILDKKFIKKESKSEGSLKVKEHSKKLKEWKDKHGSTLSKEINNPFTLFTEFFHENSDRKVTKEQLEQLWNESAPEVKESFIEQCKPCPDTLNSVFLPHSHFGSINERIEDLIAGYKGCNGKKDEKKFANMMKQKAMTALCDSGEAVGLLAAQSLGEPSTQMTLNTFHFAGRGEMNVTLGIPRLTEILMMASKNIKTPSMVIPFLPIENIERESEMLRKKFNRVTVSEVLKDIEVDIESDNGDTKVYIYTLKFFFLPYAQYKDNYCINPKYIVKHMKRKFFKRFFEVTRKFSKYTEPILKDTPLISEGNMDVDDDEDDKACPEADSSDEEPEDMEDARAKRRYQQKHEDQEPEAEEEQASENEDEEEHQETTEKNWVEEEMEFNGKFNMDQENYNWCELSFTAPGHKGKMDLDSILKDTAAKSVIWEVPNIKKSITYMKDGILTLRTDGINISEMSKYGHILDLKKLYCNDIHKMIEKYGIGAGTDVIVKEIEDVFNVYGIQIDPRHLMLISDFMTSKGSFEPLNRAGMKSSTSPFHQMSFESSLKFLADAVIGGKSDVLANPSSSLMTGSLCDVGTGGFHVLNCPSDSTS